MITHKSSAASIFQLKENFTVVPATERNFQIIRQVQGNMEIVIACCKDKFFTLFVSAT